ncbi:hypothetical protein C8R45DRAFT_1092057 [Mycena sanguinolenta]|nr:hypothetical protein C8R45DRAFT_1092057 [Mycena sanguinolenta]
MSFSDKSSTFDISAYRLEASDESGNLNYPPSTCSVAEPSEPPDVFESVPTTSSDETAQALAAGARKAFVNARDASWAGEPGPFILEGEYSLAAFEALSSTLESKSRFAYVDRKIILCGDPGDVHEEVSDLLADVVKLIDWNSHSDTPNELAGPLGQKHLLVNKCSATRRWKLSPTSATVYCKEADVLFCARTAVRQENGAAIEVAHKNESFPALCHEIQNWTTGQGHRALLAVGIKIDTKPPYHRDARLRLVVADSTATPESEHCRVYEFGSGTCVVPRERPRSGPITAVLKTSEGELDDCSLHYFSPADPASLDLIVDLPVGAALFADIAADAFLRKFNIILEDSFMGNLRTKHWRLDLGYLRYQVSDIIQNDASA